MDKKTSSRKGRTGARKHSRADVNRESGANPARTLVLRKPRRSAQ
jgi:hypothetical protein